MRATEQLHDQGQSIWLDNITRRMLDSGQVARYLEDYAVTGLTSNPSIFDLAIQSGDYDAEIRDKVRRGASGEELFFDLAVEEMPVDGGDCDAVLARFAAAGVDVGALAAQLQEEGAAAFDASRRDLLHHIDQQARS
ncbi:MAG TPA: transaldolase family protein [Candidatus Sulfotelmatobacter sp.]|nr:transaldolase family protein [Candidatus Sulfotelmatobacter sp.]